MPELIYFFDCGGKWVMQLGLVLLLGVGLLITGRKYGFEEVIDERNNGD